MWKTSLCMSCREGGGQSGRSGSANLGGIVFSYCPGISGAEGGKNEHST